MWILEELSRRDWTPADLAKRADIHQATLSNILNGNRKAGPEICLAIAQALGEKPEKIFRMAGLLPPSHGDMDDLSQDEVELIQAYRSLPTSHRQTAIDVVRGLADRLERRRKDR
jgi:transcriptional regulator with XRE-family HTH domain